jgi:hypothetical protein
MVYYRCGVVFLGEEGESMSVMVKGKVCHYRKLNSLEFTSGKLPFEEILKLRVGTTFK